MYQLFWQKRKNQGTLTEGEGAVSSVSLVVLKKHGTLTEEEGAVSSLS
jgi:hypothetical protein